VDDAHLIGNIIDTPLGELLESRAQREFGSAKLEHLPHMCRACEVREMCHGECPKNRFVIDPEGGPPINYLCEGYKRFFTHVKPFVQAVADEWRRNSGR